jgi:hypothetical protein
VGDLMSKLVITSAVVKFWKVKARMMFLVGDVLNGNIVGGDR